MKKWMIAFIMIVVAIPILVYISIPATIVIQKSVGIKINQQTLRRMLIENNNWKQWWPQNINPDVKNDTGQTATFNGNTYSIIDKKYNSLYIAVRDSRDTVSIATLDIIAIASDSVKLEWSTNMVASANPINKWQNYLVSKKAGSDAADILQRIASFLSVKENIYGLRIWQESVKDSTLISTFDSIKGYPHTAFIYSLIEKLKNYVSVKHALVTGYPMLNIYTKDSIIYVVKVALPVNKILPDQGNITYKWMLPHGRILVAAATGDSSAIAHAFQQVEYYVKDFGKQAPAIPFLSLITDRMKEKDSTKWITRIYYPIME